MLNRRHWPKKALFANSNKPEQPRRTPESVRAAGQAPPEQDRRALFWPIYGPSKVVVVATLRPDFLAAKSRSSSRATRKTPSQSRRARSKDHRRDFSSSEPPIPSASGTKSRRRLPRYERQSAASAATSKQGAIGSAAARSSRPFADTSFERKDRRLRCSERERGSAAKREIDMGDWASKGTTKSMGGGLGCLETAYPINISILRACCSDLNATDRA